MTRLTVNSVATAAEARLAARNAKLLAEAQQQVAAAPPVDVPEGNTEMTSKTTKTTTKTVKPVATKKEKPMCACGCGVRTGGGIFCPGHDAKLKSQLFAAARGTDKDAAAAALTELDKRGWTWLMAKAKPAVKKLSKAEVALTEEDDSLWTAMLTDGELAGLTV